VNNKQIFVFEVLIAVTTNSTVLYDLEPSSLVKFTDVTEESPASILRTEKEDNRVTRM
jgi:hypothetical protein